MTFFVKIPAKFRRGVSASRRMSPIWSFTTEVEAIEFAKSFTICYVDVTHDGKVIFRNYSLEKPKWMSEAESTVAREQNRQTQDDMAQKAGYGKKRRGAV